MDDQQPPHPPEPAPDQPTEPLQLSYRTPDTRLREAWEGSISPFSKVFVAGLLFVLFAGSLLAIAMFFIALLRS